VKPYSQRKQPVETSTIKRLCILGQNVSNASPAPSRFLNTHMMPDYLMGTEKLTMPTQHAIPPVLVNSWGVNGHTT